MKKRSLATFIICLIMCGILAGCSASTDATPAENPVNANEDKITTEDGKTKKALDKYLYDLGSCTFCGLCVSTCPTDAIEFSNDFEQAVFRREALLKQLNYLPEKEKPAPEPKPAPAPKPAAPKPEEPKEEPKPEEPKAEPKAEEPKDVQPNVEQKETE